MAAGRPERTGPAGHRPRSHRRGTDSWPRGGSGVGASNVYTRIPFPSKMQPQEEMPVGHPGPDVKPTTPSLHAHP